MNKIIKEDVQTIAKEVKDLEGKIKGNTFLITGGAGFLGTWMCDVLVEMGAKVICVDNLVVGTKENIDHLMGNKNFKFVEADILNYEPTEKIDYIVHMASIAAPMVYFEHPIETMDTNIIAAKKMLELGIKNKIKGFLLTSTSEIYGNPPNDAIPTLETYYGMINTTSTRAMYDESKRAAETYCYYYWKKHKVPVRIVRIFNTYGPRLDSGLSTTYGRALINFVRQAMANQPLTIYGDGKQTRSFCYIIDNMKGLLRFLLSDGLDGEIINIGNPQEITILDLAQRILKATGSKSEIKTNSQPAHYNINDDPKRRCPNTAKANRLLNYEPKVLVDDGLRKMVEQMKISNLNK
jgi:UDP-glucuronate decarboxylase